MDASSGSLGLVDTAAQTDGTPYRPAVTRTPFYTKSYYSGHSADNKIASIATTGTGSRKYRAEMGPYCRTLLY